MSSVSESEKERKKEEHVEERTGGKEKKSDDDDDGRKQRWNETFDAETDAVSFFSLSRSLFSYLSL